MDYFAGLDGHRLATIGCHEARASGTPTRRRLGRVIHYEKLRSRRGPCDTSSALKTGPSGNCRRFSIRRRASGPIPCGRCCRAGPSHYCS